MGLSDAGYWLGGFDYGHEGQWEWIHSGQSVNYTAWAESYPTNDTDFNCVNFGRKEAHNTWADQPCEWKYYPMCKAPFKPKLKV